MGSRLEGIKPRSCSLEPRKTALIIVDMQKDFVYPDGKLYVPGSEKIIPSIRMLLDRARANRVKVVYTQDWHPENSPEFKIWPEHCVMGSRGAEIVDELKPQPGELIIRKETYDAFYRTELEERLREANVENVIVTGVVANICVLHTAGSAALRGLKIVLPVDCTVALNEFDYRLTLRQVSFLYKGTITRSDLLSFEKQSH